MSKTADYYHQAFIDFEKRAGEAINLSSPFAQRIAYLIQEELLTEDFNEYLRDSQDSFNDLPEEVTAKDLVDLVVQGFDFTAGEINELTFLGIIVDALEDFIKMFLRLGFMKRISESEGLSNKLNENTREGMDELINRESLALVIAYLKDMKDGCVLGRDVEDWEFPSLKPYVIRSMFFGRKLGDYLSRAEG